MWGETRDRLVGRKITLVALAVLILVALAAGPGPLLAPYDPFAIHAKDMLVSPSLQYPMGTDESGRDLFSRILFGARVSVAVGLVAAALSLSLGIAPGLIAGYRGGRVDDVIMRILDGFLAVPPVLLALTLVASMGPSVVNAALAIGVMGAPLTARITRAAVLVEKNKDYVLAARSLGAGEWHLVVRNILPNCLPPLVVAASLLIANAILLEAALSFLGLGVQPPQPSWGSLLQLGYQYVSRTTWYVTFPGLAIFVTVWSLNMLGDGLRDALDPRLRGTT